MSSELKRATGLLVIEVVNSNPNGDPDRESDPRQRPNGLGEISPVSLCSRKKPWLQCGNMRATTAYLAGWCFPVWQMRITRTPLRHMDGHRRQRKCRNYVQQNGLRRWIGMCRSWAEMVNGVGFGAKCIRRAAIWR